MYLLLFFRYGRMPRTILMNCTFHFTGKWTGNRGYMFFFCSFVSERFLASSYCILWSKYCLNERGIFFSSLLFFYWRNVSMEKSGWLLSENKRNYFLFFFVAGKTVLLLPETKKKEWLWKWGRGLWVNKHFKTKVFIETIVNIVTHQSIPEIEKGS